ncbi:MAG: type I 3-dehydroquinate dehydratase [Eubacteriales bacterium]
MNKPTFLGHSEPLYCCMIQTRTPENALSTIRRAIDGGCTAFGFQQCQLEQEYRTDYTIRSIFEAMEGRPVYVTNYRVGLNTGMTDDELADGLLTLAERGATLCDVMGDLFCRHPLELTDDADAIDKQRRLIDRIHHAGGEVLMSSHVLKYTPAEEVLRIALEQQKRGADIVKIVTAANSEAEQLENLRITSLLKETLDVPFLFLSGGTHCALHRMIGPMLGCVMYLCVQEYDELATKSQPLLADVRAVREHLPYISK